MKKKWNQTIIAGLLFLLCLITGCNSLEGGNTIDGSQVGSSEIGTSGGTSIDSLSEIPEYDGQEYITVHENEPDFDQESLDTKSYESYSDLDSLGRCQTAEANIGEDLMPTEKRESIGQVKPSGWHTVKYDNVDGKYLYNRCHLIGYQLTAENANEKNLITGTRYMNVEGMLPFENMVADYIKETGNHVMYRVTPVFEGDNLVASGVQMEALSVEDDGDGICYNVFVYNVQPGIVIDYATGESKEGEEQTGNGGKEKTATKNTKVKNTYILNTNTKKFHQTSCSSADDIQPENREKFTGSREELVKKGYEPCGRCKP